jgi:hypothetical protein
MQLTKKQFAGCLAGAVATAVLGGVGGVALAAGTFNPAPEIRTQPLEIDGVKACKDVTAGQPCYDSVYQLQQWKDGYGNPIAAVNTDGGLGVFGDRICTYNNGVFSPSVCLGGRNTVDNPTTLKTTTCKPGAIIIVGDPYGQVFRCRTKASSAGAAGAGYDKVSTWTN